MTCEKGKKGHVYFLLEKRTRKGNSQIGVKGSQATIFPENTNLCPFKLGCMLLVGVAALYRLIAVRRLSWNRLYIPL